MRNNVEVSDPTDNELFAEGMRFVDDALSRFMEIKDDRSEHITKVLHGILVLLELIYGMRKK